VGIDSRHAALRDLDRRMIGSPPLEKGRTDRPACLGWAIFKAENRSLSRFIPDSGVANLLFSAK
jgi:hypothetical protein